MTEEGFKASWRCPACGRENRATAALCSFCLAARPGTAGIADEPRPAVPLPEERDDDSPPRPPTAPSGMPLPMWIGVFIIVTCVLLIPFFGTGLALLVALTPALIRIFRAGTESSANPLVRPTWDRRWGCSGPVAVVGVTLLTVVSSLITLVAVCLPPTFAAAMENRPWAGSEFPVWVGWAVGVPAGILAAGGVGYGVVRLLFREEKRKGGPWEPPGGDDGP